MVYQEEVHISTHGHGDIHLLDDAAEKLVQKSGIQTGWVHLFNVGSTGAITMMELEPGLEKDFPTLLNDLIPPGTHYGHEQAWHDGNAHSHLQASIIGSSFTAPVQGGRLQLGTWQQIIHLECDNKPRERRIIVTVQGE